MQFEQILGSALSEELWSRVKQVKDYVQNQLIDLNLTVTKQLLELTTMQGQMVELKSKSKSDQS